MSKRVQAASALLMAEFVRVITRSNLVVWSRTDDDDETAGFSAALDTGGASDLEIMVRPSEVLRGGRWIAGRGFRVDVSWFDKADADVVVAEMGAAIEAELYDEVKASYLASGSRAAVDAKVAIIRRASKEEAAR